MSVHRDTHIPVGRGARPLRAGSCPLTGCLLFQPRSLSDVTGKERLSGCASKPLMQVRAMRGRPGPQRTLPTAGTGGAVLRGWFQGNRRIDSVSPPVS